MDQEPQVPVSDFNRLAQYNHVMAGALAVLIPKALFNVFGWKPVLCCAIFMVVVAAWKEFWYDARKEPPIIRGSDLEDFSMYCAGVFLGLICIMGSVHCHWS